MNPRDTISRRDRPISFTRSPLAFSYLMARRVPRTASSATSILYTVDLPLPQSGNTVERQVRCSGTSGVPHALAMKHPLRITSVETLTCSTRGRRRREIVSRGRQRQSPDWNSECTSRSLGRLESQSSSIDKSSSSRRTPIFCLSVFSRPFAMRFQLSFFLAVHFSPVFSPRLIYICLWFAFTRHIRRFGARLWGCRGRSGGREWNMLIFCVRFLFCFSDTGPCVYLWRLKATRLGAGQLGGGSPCLPFYVAGPRHVARVETQDIHWPLPFLVRC